MKPVIFIGMGRSGTTIIFEALARHPDVGFFTNYTDKFFRFPQIGFIHRIFRRLGEKPQGQKTHPLNKILPKTTEAYFIWSELCGDKFRYSFMKGTKATKDEIYRTREIRFENSFLAG